MLRRNGRLVIIRVNHDVNLIVIAVQHCNGSAGSEHIIVRMRREHKNGFVLYAFKTRLLCPSVHNREEQKERKRQTGSHQSSFAIRLQLSESSKVAKIHRFVEEKSHVRRPQGFSA